MTFFIAVDPGGRTFMTVYVASIDQGDSEKFFEQGCKNYLNPLAASFPNYTLINWGDEAYTTEVCGYLLRRDVHGALNILIKLMAECGEYLSAL